MFGEVIRQPEVRGNAKGHRSWTVSTRPSSASSAPPSPPMPSSNAEHVFGEAIIGQPEGRGKEGTRQGYTCSERPPSASRSDEGKWREAEAVV